MTKGFTYLKHEILVNADDFGYNTEVNRAIHLSFLRGMIHQTSLLIHMDGFEDAIHTAKLDPHFLQNIGIHLNLTEGSPLTDSLKSCPRFCDGSGKFIFKRNRSLYSLTKPERTAIYQELKAQMDAMRVAGIRPHHIDSHHHIHTEWPILKIVIRLAKENGIRKIRWARNMGVQNSWPKKVYRFLLNRYLKHRMGLPDIGLFGNLDDFAFSRKKLVPGEPRSIEIMVHPALNKSQAILDNPGGDLMEKLKTLFPDVEIPSNGNVE